MGRGLSLPISTDELEAKTAFPQAPCAESRMDVRNRTTCRMRLGDEEAGAEERNPRDEGGAARGRSQANRTSIPAARIDRQDGGEAARRQRGRLQEEFS